MLLSRRCMHQTVHVPCAQAEAWRQRGAPQDGCCAPQQTSAWRMMQRAVWSACACPCSSARIGFNHWATVLLVPTMCCVCLHGRVLRVSAPLAVRSYGGTADCIHARFYTSIVACQHKINLSQNHSIPRTTVSMCPLAPTYHATSNAGCNRSVLLRTQIRSLLRDVNVRCTLPAHAAGVSVPRCIALAV